MPRKTRSAKPTDADFRGDQEQEPTLMESAETSEERFYAANPITTGGKVMPIIDFSEYNLDDIPELKTLPAGSEVRLRILDVEIRPDKNGDHRLNIRLDVADEPLVKEIFHGFALPSANMSEKRKVMEASKLKSLCQVFEIRMDGTSDTSEWLGREAWAILTYVPEGNGYPEKNDIARWLKPA